MDCNYPLAVTGKCVCFLFCWPISLYRRLRASIVSSVSPESQSETPDEQLRKLDRMAEQMDDIVVLLREQNRILRALCAGNGISVPDIDPASPSLDKS